MKLGPSIPATHAAEQDVFTGWRREIARLSRAGQTRKTKRRYNRRVRHTARLDLITETLR